MFAEAITEEELKEMVSVIDQDGDGDINFNEFVWLMTRWNKLSFIDGLIVVDFQGF